MNFKSKLGFVFFGLFFLPFFCVGCVASWQIVKHFGEVRMVSSWEETPATVSFIKSYGQSEEPFIDTVYEYSVGSEEFEGREAGVLNKGGVSGFVFSSWESEIFDKQEAGEIISCFYNPDNFEEAVLFRSVVWDHVFFFGVFSLVFGMVGLGGFAMVAWAYKNNIYKEKLKARYPEEPWRWKKVWETGRIRCNGQNTILFLWPFLVIWNSITLPAMIPAYKAFMGGEKLAVLVVLFPICGLIMIRWVIQKTLSYRRTGASTLRLKTFPGVTGGLFSGMFTTGKSISLENDVSFKLQCFETEPARGRNSSSSKRLIWSDELTIEGRKLGNLNYSGVPIEFSVPYDCRPTFNGLGNDIDWSLAVKSVLNGSDLDVSFDVPVFKTKDSDPTVTDMNPLPVKKGKIVPVEEFIEKERFSVEGPSGGVTSIGISSVIARLPGVYFSTLVAMIIFSSGLAATIYYGLGFIPILVSSIFVIVIGLALAQFSFATKILVRKHSLEVVKTFLFYSRSKSYDLNAQSTVEFKHSASGNVGDDHTSYYSITLNEGKTLVNMIDSTKAARWLADRILEAAGIEPSELGDISDSDSIAISHPDQVGK